MACLPSPCHYHQKSSLDPHASRSQCKGEIWRNSEECQAEQQETTTPVSMVYWQKQKQCAIPAWPRPEGNSLPRLLELGDHLCISKPISKLSKADRQSSMNQSWVHLYPVIFSMQQAEHVLLFNSLPRVSADEPSMA